MSGAISDVCCPGAAASSGRTCANAREPHHYAHVDAPFGDGELRVDCADHVPLRSEEAEAVWPEFLAAGADGTDAVARWPLSDDGFEELKKTVLLGDDDDIRYLRMSHDVLAGRVEDVLDVWCGFVALASNPHLRTTIGTPFSASAMKTRPSCGVKTSPITVRHCAMSRRAPGRRAWTPEPRRWRLTRGRPVDR